MCSSWKVVPILEGGGGGEAAGIGRSCQVFICIKQIGYLITYKIISFKCWARNMHSTLTNWHLIVFTPKEKVTYFAFSEKQYKKIIKLSLKWECVVILMELCAATSQTALLSTTKISYIWDMNVLLFVTQGWESCVYYIYR